MIVPWRGGHRPIKPRGQEGWTRDRSTAREPIDRATNSRTARLRGLSHGAHDLGDQLARHVGQAHVAPVEIVGESLVVDAEQVQQGGVYVVVPDDLFGSLVA